MTKLNAEQIDAVNTAVNIVQQVLRGVVISLAASNPPAVPALLIALRAGAADGRFEKTACALLANLADGLDEFAKEAEASRH